MTSEASELLRGAVDLHYHSGPSPFPRKMDVAQAAVDYDAAGFRAVVMKSHHHSTVMEILALQSTLLNRLKIEVIGGVALNGAVGGLNTRAVDLSLKMGGKIVWFPTMSSGAHIDYHKVHHDSRFPTNAVPVMAEEKIDVFDESGKLRREVFEIIDLIKETDSILSFGHMAPHQIDAVLEVALSRGVKRLILHHPDFVCGVSHEQAKAYAERGVLIEHSLSMYNDQAPREPWPIGRLVEWIQVIGPDRTSLGSDVGQLSNPSGVDTFRRVVELLLQAGIPEDDIAKMIRRNPGELLGLT